MTADFDERWKRLAESAQRAWPPVAPIPTDRVGRIARQGLALRAFTERTRPSEPWALAGLAGFVAASAVALLWIDLPLTRNVSAAASELSLFSRRVPPRPALPAPPQVGRPFDLPSPPPVVAALTDWR
jgi:hypothetical protein